MTSEQKKRSLLEFMEWKMSHSGETKEEIEETLNKCRKMSYKALHRYAVLNDFIDY